MREPETVSTIPTVYMNKQLQCRTETDRIGQQVGFPNGSADATFPGFNFTFCLDYFDREYIH